MLSIKVWLREMLGTRLAECQKHFYLSHILEDQY